MKLSKSPDTRNIPILSASIDLQNSIQYNPVSGTSLSPKRSISPQRVQKCSANFPVQQSTAILTQSTISQQPTILTQNRTKPQLLIQTQPLQQSIAVQPLQQSIAVQPVQAVQAIQPVIPVQQVVQLLQPQPTMAQQVRQFASVPASPKVIYKEKVVEVEKPVFYEKEVEKIVEKEVPAKIEYREIEKQIEKPIYYEDTKKIEELEKRVQQLQNQLKREQNSHHETRKRQGKKHEPKEKIVEVPKYIEKEVRVENTQQIKQLEKDVVFWKKQANKWEYKYNDLNSEEIRYEIIGTRRSSHMGRSKCSDNYIQTSQLLERGKSTKNIFTPAYDQTTVESTTARTSMQNSGTRQYGNQKRSNFHPNETVKHHSKNTIKRDGSSSRIYKNTNSNQGHVYGSSYESSSSNNQRAYGGHHNYQQQMSSSTRSNKHCIDRDRLELKYL